MSAHVIFGDILAKNIFNTLSADISSRHLQNTIGLATILVGNDEASKIYVAHKRKAAALVGIRSVHYDLAENTSEAELLTLITMLNNNNSIYGILVQLPLPPNICKYTIIEAIDPHKDVDGFHPLNLGYLMSGSPRTIACTPLGILYLINSINYIIKGKHAVVVGRSAIVGRPLAQLLLKADATVTVCHRHTKNLAEITKSADLLVVAVGKAKIITKDHVKPGAFVIDVGINKDEHNRLCGDVDFAEVSSIASYITPVPKGVGPLTIAMLLKNTWDNYVRSLV
jgi:methylenetetrahydrofolate dehydrogenase (NADP+)/methenyltetrahydrofolate cyclohydrolase